MFSKRALARGGAAGSVTVFQYRPTMQTDTRPAMEEPSPEQMPEPEIRITQDLLARRLQEERALASAEVEARLRLAHQQHLGQERAKIAETIGHFEQSRKEYFAKVEAEVVQLALAIARKILHREVQVDPMLVTALVQIALGQMKEGAAVSMRVNPEEARRWREQLASLTVPVEVTVVEDTTRQSGDCVLETELGSVNFSLNAQLKEVEQGFLDVLARTPQI
jgi:flagellar assembly protein FliH